MSTVTTDTIPAATGALEHSEPLNPGVLVLNTKQIVGSAQHVHAMIARLLDKERFRVFVATPPECNEPMEWENVPEVKLWRLPMGLSISKQRGGIAKVGGVLSAFQLILSLVVLSGRARHQKIKIIHTATTPRDALGGWLLSLLSGAKLVVHWHHVYWGEYPLFWRLAFRRAEIILACSEASASSLLPLGIPPSKLRVLYNGVDHERFRPGLDGAAVRQEFGIPPDDVLVLLPGRLCPVKGQTDLLRAVSLLRQRHIPVKALIVGNDDPSATPGGASHRIVLERMCEELGIADHVLFENHRHDMPQVMAAADVVVVPSYEEPFGLVVVEAMACGRPLIGTCSGAIPEIINDGETGLMVSVGSPEQLAQAIERLVKDKKLRHDLGARARQETERRFRHDQVAHNAADIYQTLVRD